MKKYIEDYLKYDNTSITGLRWIKSPNYKYKVGDEAFTRIDRYGYYAGYFGGRTYQAHQVIMFLQRGEWSSSKKQIDHSDGNKKNNNIDNLRFVSPTGNQKNANRKLNVNNTSGVKGVDLYSIGGYSYWRARHYTNGKRVSKTSKNKQVVLDWLNEKRENDAEYLK
tara:strand:+ start:313 stop:810 length:498 start_codon:yes stop_codon:yes gene_type:complete